MGTVYLLHFSEPYHHAEHYLGWTDNLPQRLRQHRSGFASPLCRAAVQAGIRLQLVKYWPDVGRSFERKLKRQKNSPRLCPICARKVASTFDLSEIRVAGKKCDLADFLF